MNEDGKVFAGAVVDRTARLSLFVWVLFISNALTVHEWNIASRFMRINYPDWLVAICSTSVLAFKSSLTTMAGQLG
ncbi:hypothetical protein PQU96_11720 [Vogesella sp. LYT5W]|uniref:MFS transporter n=1 Tax=Vogesella margarita TaxID=2984199 RepID=A0ABT5IT47_9NEIS|nr:hypothetical protein [Vogesella margarita]MDC7714784.1 hypothetical protein [Vogesella margarita]